MIDFKQFLTTIAAIFLALAVGVALGAGPLKGTADEQLRINAEKLSKDKDALQKQLLTDQAESKYRDEFTDSVSAQLVANKLAARKVVLVTLPGSDGADTKDMATLVREAGGTVTGTVEMQPKFFDPTQTAFVDGVAAQSVSSVSATDIDIPATATGYERDGYVLARALVSKGPTPGPDPTAQTILSAFKDAGLVKAPDKLERASLVIFIAGPAPDATDAMEPDAILGLAIGLDASCDGSVMGGPPESAVDNGAVAVIRGDDQAKKMVSTVDQLQVPAGQVSIVFALSQQVDGKTGHYGMVGRTDSAAPDMTTP